MQQSHSILGLAPPQSASRYSNSYSLRNVHISSGIEPVNKFPPSDRTRRFTICPRSEGIFPLKLLLPRRASIKFGKANRKSIDPVKLFELISIRSTSTELSASIEISPVISLFPRRMSFKCCTWNMAAGRSRVRLFSVIKDTKSVRYCNVHALNHWNVILLTESTYH